MVAVDIFMLPPMLLVICVMVRLPTLICQMRMSHAIAQSTDDPSTDDPSTDGGPDPWRMRAEVLCAAQLSLLDIW